MSARITQGGKVQWSQYSYSWCNDKEIKDPASPWSHEDTYCNLLLTAQVSDTTTPFPPPKKLQPD